MRSPVYRNLDQPLQILGFSIFELIILCLTLVLSGEIVQVFSISRIWSFLFTMLLAFGFFSTRKSLGDLFVKRLVRFIALPSRLEARLVPRKSRISGGVL